MADGEGLRDPGPRAHLPHAPDVHGAHVGSIAALFGLTNGIISPSQYSQLVTVVILSAFVPTLVAQQLFQPKLIDEEEEEALGAEDASLIRRLWRNVSPPKA